MHLSDYLFRNAKKWPNKPAIITSDRTLDWQELAREVSSASAAIEQNLSLRKEQQIIAILVPNGWQYVVLYLAIVHLGHIALPVDITFKKLEIDFVLDSVDPDLVITNKQTAPLVSRRAILANKILKTSLLSPEQTYRIAPTKQIATIFLSSGTTGRPKPIPNTHANQLWDVKAIAAPFGWTQRDNLLITLHLSHRHGLVICLLSAIYHGNTVYLTERFSAEATIKMLESGKISLYLAVPSVYEQLLNFKPGSKVDLSKVRLFATSSSPMPPTLAQAFKSRYGLDILDRYGTSETGSIATRRSSLEGVHSQPIKGVNLRIEPNGEVAISSPGIFPGYYKNPVATKRSMTKDGWWLTGDIGAIENGRLVLRGRTKERIIRSGYTIYPVDIEWALKKNSKVSEVKIISKSDKNRLDDQVFAFFTGNISVEQLSDYSRLNLPRSWRPDKFIKLKSMPRTANGKPRISELSSMIN